MADSFSLKDHLFNAQSIGDLGREYAAALPGFDADAFVTEVLAGLAGRGLLERIDWIADCLQARLAPDFPTMADQLEAAMPPILDPDLSDDDFGRFIHAVPGILAVRHGLEEFPDRALDLIYEATKRFSMEFYIRPFLNRWPEKTLARLKTWARDPNYHVRRLVSEGTRPRLPWAKAITLDPRTPLPLLHALHGDPNRYVTRSVANHLNDIARTDPDLVVATLADWATTARQNPRELEWMSRHALRGAIKRGHPGSMRALGFEPDAPVTLEELDLSPPSPAIGGRVTIVVTLSAPVLCPVLVDYIIWFKRPGGRESAKVHKLKQARLAPGEPLSLTKTHVFKGDATTYTLVPGSHRLAVQVNGRILGEISFDLRP